MEGKLSIFEKALEFSKAGTNVSILCLDGKLVSNVKIKDVKGANIESAELVVVANSSKVSYAPLSISNVEKIIESTL